MRLLLQRTVRKHGQAASN